MAADKSKNNPAYAPFFDAIEIRNEDGHNAYQFATLMN